MAEQVAAGDGGEQAAQPQQASWFSAILRMVTMYMIFNWLFGGGKKSAVPSGDGSRVIMPHSAVWQRGQPFHCLVYLSNASEFDLPPGDVIAADERALQSHALDDALVVDTDVGVHLVASGRFALDWTDGNALTRNVTLRANAELQNNGSYFAHVFMVQPPALAKASARSRESVLELHAPLNKYMQKKRERKKRSLLDAELAVPEVEEVDESADGGDGGDEGERPIVSYWKPELRVNFVVDFTTYPANGIPAQLRPYLTMVSESACRREADGECATVPDRSSPKDTDGQHLRRVTQYEVRERYLPVVWLNDFWLLQEQLTAVNETVAELPLMVEVAPLSLFKWQLYVQMNESFRMQESWGTAAEGESDMFKQMLTDTNPYLLALTFVVSIAHMIFDFLAFKNDIHFWRTRATKSLEGISVRTLFLSIFSKVVIFLYLLDNDTSWMILLSSGIDVVIEMWKITKATDVSMTRWHGVPWPKFDDRASYAQSKTKAYDAYAMTYLGYVLFPAVIGCSAYSLVHSQHAGWYSWIIGSLCGAIYTLGFFFMTPQLFINYKLKSVAHLPWRVMTYKVCNTFIDDLFAFIIKAPTMHRLACFRDDIVFFIFLYQRYIYRVDYKRVNEFGISGDDYLREKVPAGVRVRAAALGDAAERDAIDSAVRTAFAVGAEQAQAASIVPEVRLVHALREHGDAAIELVAAAPTAGVIGHVALSPLRLRGAEHVRALALAPLAVTFKYQRQGVGRQLLEAAIDRAREDGYQCLVVLGHKALYAKFGFEHELTRVLACAYKRDGGDAYMARDLGTGEAGGALRALCDDAQVADDSIEVIYSPAFASIESADEKKAK